MRAYRVSVRGVSIRNPSAAAVQFSRPPSPSIVTDSIADRVDILQRLDNDRLSRPVQRNGEQRISLYRKADIQCRILHFLPFAESPSLHLRRPFTIPDVVPRPVNRLAVHIQPVADFQQQRFLLIRDCPVRAGSYIEEGIPVLAHAVDEVIHQRIGRIYIRGY